MCHRTGRGFRRGSAKRAPLLNPCLPARAGGEPPQWEIQTDKGVVRPAAEGEDTAPQDVQHFHVAVGDQWSPNGQARSAWPNKGRGRLACPNPPCVSIPAQARRSRYFERGRGGSVPQLPQAAPGCPQALARSLTSRAGLRGPAPSLPRSFPARDWTTAVAPCVSGPARQGRDGRGRVPRTGVRGDGSERHSTVQHSRAHRPDQLGWRPVLPAGTGGAARRGRPDQRHAMRE